LLPQSPCPGYKDLLIIEENLFQRKSLFLPKKGYFAPLFDQKLLFLPLKLAIYGLKANSRIDQDHQ
jgi:hypothetical protein